MEERRQGGKSTSDMHEVLWLTSFESRRFADVFECTMVRRFTWESGEPAYVVSLKPSVHGYDFGIVGDIPEFVVSSRLGGLTVDDRDEMPLFVHLAIPPVGWSPDSGPRTAEGFMTVAWVELYRTRDDAEQRRVDPRELPGSLGADRS